MPKSYMTLDWPERIIVNAHADWMKRDVRDADSGQSLANVKSATVAVSADGLMSIAIVALEWKLGFGYVKGADGLETFERAFVVNPDSGFSAAIPCESKSR